MKKNPGVLLAFCLAGLGISFGLLRAGTGQFMVRAPAVAGAFYPADSAELATTVSGLLAQSRLSQPLVKPVALICPHAGYVYSGGVAAAAYRQLSGYRYSTVVLVAPSHHEYFDYS
jgi:MEMO1 family protein